MSKKEKTSGHKGKNNPFGDFIDHIRNDDTTQSDTSLVKNKKEMVLNSSLMSKIDEMKLNRELKKSLDFLEKD